MKSISIVYKRSKTIRDPQAKKQQQPDMRTTANEYYTRLLEKGVNRQELIQKIRSKTAKASKLLDRKNVFSSLSIASISTPQPTTLLKSGTEKKLPSPTIFNIKKPKSDTIFSLKLPDQLDKEHNFMRRSPTKQIAKHAKVKVLSKIRCEKDVTLIVSVDFVCNQYSFWQDEGIEEGCLRTWKLLMPLANIIWIVRSEATSRKLQAFTQSKGLRLDGIVQIESSKKQSLTISYSNIEEQAKFQRGHKILIINCLKTDIISSSQLAQFQFRSSLPIISHPNTYVHFVQIDMNNRNRFSAIKRIVTQELPKPFNLHSVLEDHRERKGKFLSHKKVYENYISLEQNSPNIANKMEKFKTDLLSYFEQSFGLKTKLEGDSLTYIVGDMIKRNYSIAKEYYAYCAEVQEREECRQMAIPDTVVGSNIKRFQYNRPIYVWQA